MNRRDALKAAAIAPFSAAVVALPTEKPVEDPFAGFTAERFIELPLKLGDEITGLTVFRDELWAATRFGELYRISDFT